METEFGEGNFPRQTCSMNIKSLSRAVCGLDLNDLSLEEFAPNSLVNHLNALERLLRGDKSSRSWNLFHEVCVPLGELMQDTRVGLEALLIQDEQTSFPDGKLSTENVTSRGTKSEQSEQSHLWLTLKPRC